MYAWHGMRSSRSALALVASITFAMPLGGCFGYNRSAKRWAYAGDTILVLGGGTAIALDATSKEAACSGDNCLYRSSVHGQMVAGVVLVAAGLAGFVFNATRDNVKTSR